MNITRTQSNQMARQTKPAATPPTNFKPASEENLRTVDDFVANQHKDGEGGIALVILGLLAVPTVLGAVGGGTLAHMAFDTGILGTAAGTIGGGVLGGGLAVAYLSGGD